MRKTSGTAVVALPLLLIAAAPAPAPQTGPASDSGLIVNRVSGKCIDVRGTPGVANGAQVQLWDCEYSGEVDGTPSDQYWTFTRSGFIRNAVSGKCLDVPGSPGTTNGLRLILWDCERVSGDANGAPTDQRWERRPDGTIRNLLSGKCIDVMGTPGTANGSPIQLWDCEETGRTQNGEPTDQRWYS